VKLRLGVDLVVCILACALAASLLLVGISAVLNVALGRNPAPSLGENTTQVMTTVLGGIIGVVGTYVGYYVRGYDEHKREREHHDAPDEQPTRTDWPRPG
jgi:hypothetical protein